ncbi:HU family DNA-binding protein [Parabacteroides sp.]
MAFFKKVKKKVNGLWYPQSVTVGKPITTDEIADRLAKISTVSRADTYAVLKELGGVMADYMAQGRTVKLEGLGTYYYTANASKNGVDDPKKVDASLISDVRVRFIPEITRTASGRVASRSLVSDNIFWMELPDGVESSAPDEGGGDEERPGEL